MIEMNSTSGNGFGSRRLTVELTNICNLHCSYCLRDEDALYNTRASFIAPEFLESIIKQAKQVIGITHLTFTGGEPTLHPQFDDVLRIIAANGLKTSFVTNGWNFEKISPKLVNYRNTITHVAFSLDGPTREDHDKWRGDGSFVRLIRAFSRCFAADVPFLVKVGIRRDTLPNLEQIALFAARMGAAGLNFMHVMPTSADVEDASALNLDERRLAEKEIASLSRIFKMKIGIDVGYSNLDPSPPCSALAGVSCNVDYLGRLSLCCNLSGFRGGVREEDVAADLHKQDFAAAYARLSKIARDKLAAREKRLGDLATQNLPVDLYTASPCLFCLDTFGKLPWRGSAIEDAAVARALPVLRAV
jgi:MoaA/NifB/PqqE/SkfB family radical SAM enzyme